MLCYKDNNNFELEVIKMIKKNCMGKLKWWNVDRERRKSRVRPTNIKKQRCAGILRVINLKLEPFPKIIMWNKQLGQVNQHLWVSSLDRSIFETYIHTTCAFFDCLLFYHYFFVLLRCRRFCSHTHCILVTMDCDLWIS